MRMKFSNSLLIVAVFAGFLIGANAGGKDRSQLPQAVIGAIERVFPNATVAEVDDDEDDGERIFFVRLDEPPEKRNVLVEVTRDGQLLEIDEYLRVDQLPERIEKAVKKAFPKAEVRKVEKETEMKIVYRVEVNEGNRTRRLKLSRMGRILELETRD